MQAIDVHIHTRGEEDGNKILKAMDQVGLKRAVLFSVPPHHKGGDQPHKAVLDRLAQTVAPDPDRLIGFAWIEPSLPDAGDGVKYAFEEKGLKGVKMIPRHWYPADDAPQACFAQINEYGKPLLVHTGILWGAGAQGDPESNTSQYCRPAFFEILLRYPKIRFAMAHLSWPWTDECFAVCGKFRAAQGYPKEWRSFADMTDGAPRPWKVEALRKGLYYLGDRQFLYGSDCFYAEDPEQLKGTLAQDQELLRECGCSAEAMERIFVTNAERWLGINS